MSVLLLRLAGPMQSWGVQSRFSIRETGLEPSKSGVIGLLCAALGRPRTAPLDDLAAMQMGVRVDREGRLTYDFHTAQHLLKAAGGIKDTEPSRRYYLADARFLVALQSDDHTMLSTLYNALADPVWPLYLGRKSFVPSLPVWLKDGLLTDEKLLTCLQSYPRLVEARRNETDEAVRVVIEDPNGSEVRSDQPISFAKRQFALRQVQTTFIEPMPYRDPLAPVVNSLVVNRPGVNSHAEEVDYFDAAPQNGG